MIVHQLAHRSWERFALASLPLLKPSLSSWPCSHTFPVPLDQASMATLLVLLPTTRLHAALLDRIPNMQSLLAAPLQAILATHTCKLLCKLTKLRPSSFPCCSMAINTMCKNWKNMKRDCARDHLPPFQVVLPAIALHHLHATTLLLLQHHCRSNTNL